VSPAPPHCYRRRCRRPPRPPLRGRRRLFSASRRRPRTRARPHNSLRGRSVFEHFGRRIRLWSTFNEPTCFCFCGYIAGIWRARVFTPARPLTRRRRCRGPLLLLRRWRASRARSFPQQLNPENAHPPKKQPPRRTARRRRRQGARQAAAAAHRRTHTGRHAARPHRGVPRHQGLGARRPAGADRRVFCAAAHRPLRRSARARSPARCCGTSSQAPRPTPPLQAWSTSTCASSRAAAGCRSLTSRRSRAGSPTFSARCVRVPPLPLPQNPAPAAP